MMNTDQKFEAASESYNKGDLLQAENVLKEIVHIQPGNTDALYLLAEISYRSGNYEAAVQYTKNALQYDPDNAEAYSNLGFILQCKGQLDDAIESFQKAIQLNPNLAEAYINLGNAFKANEQFDDAIRCYQKALQLNPGLPGAYINLGIAFQKTGQPDEAILYCQKALELNPGDANMYYNLGIAFQEKGQLDEAVTFFQKASHLAPHDAGIYNNLAFALQENRRPYEAIPYYRKALQLDPDYATAHWNLSLALLLTGEFREGWKEYEWRWDTEYLIPSRRNFKKPLWDGSEIKGRTILLHAEQGFGDTIQFIRYAPVVAERGARVIFECPGELASLLRSVERIEQVVLRGEELPDFDLHCPLLSLPLAFDTTLETVPANVPYIASDMALTRTWGGRLKHENSKIKIGLAWAGNPGFKQNRYRNIPLERFAPLCQLSRFQFYSLQKGEEAKEAINPPDGMKLSDYSEKIHDFSDTAAIIENLDLVISVDTAVAHLAGALGKPVWTLLPYSPEWRWLLDRENSPWYPTMRIFRQRSHGDWQTVIDRVVVELRSLIAG